jgi:hypothetical protein
MGASSHSRKRQKVKTCILSCTQLVFFYIRLGVHFDFISMGGNPWKVLVQFEN